MLHIQLAAYTDFGASYIPRNPVATVPTVAATIVLVLGILCGYDPRTRCAKLNVLRRVS